jgi:hypothetical protein
MDKVNKIRLIPTRKELIEISAATEEKMLQVRIFHIPGS